jgi:MerR family transcriptional regulator/heat shock protein HspR
MSMGELFGYDEPCFVISVAARMLGVRTQTLRYYERLGLVEPFRTRGNQRIYSRRDVERVRRMRTLTDDLGVNLAGVEVVMTLLDRLQESEDEAKRLAEENKKLRGMVRADRRA